MYLQKYFCIVSHNFLIDKAKYGLDKWAAGTKQVFSWEEARVFPVLDTDGSSQFLPPPQGTHDTGHCWGGHAFVILYLRKKEALERGKRE